MNDFGILVGKYLASLPTLTDTQVSELILDASGRLVISGRYLEDSAHNSGDAGLSILAVRHDAETSLVDTDGDYAPLQVDASGRLKVATLVSVEPSDAEYAEDSAHTSTDVGIHVLAVRQDTLAASTDTDGDYSSLKVDADGELYVTDEAARASLSAIETDIAAIETELLDQGTTLDSIETELQSITHAEDSAHTSTDVGVMSLAVRNDAETSLVDTDGDYSPLQTNSVGRLKVDASETLEGTEEYNATDDLAAAADGIVTITAAATPWIDVVSIPVGAGETLHVYGFAWACDQNADARLITDDTADIIVYKRMLNSSSMPSYSEHFTKDGRIEIAGAANLEVKIQIKKRNATGGNANGHANIHARLLT